MAPCFDVNCLQQAYSASSTTYTRPQGERRVKEREEERMEREVKLDENSRPKGQKKILGD
jgi:hypothetical protein